MKKLVLLERPIYQPTYRIQNESDYVISRSSRVLLLRDAPSVPDASWESFDADSLPSYFAHGMNVLHINLAQFEDFMQPFSEDNEKNLLFMIEALIQARRLIEDVQTPLAKGSAR